MIPSLPCLMKFEYRWGNKADHEEKYNSMTGWIPLFSPPPLPHVNLWPLMLMDEMPQSLHCMADILQVFKIYAAAAYLNKIDQCMFTINRLLCTFLVLPKMNDEFGTILPLDNWLIVFFSTFQLIEWLESFSLEKENTVTYCSKSQLIITIVIKKKMSV